MTLILTFAFLAFVHVTLLVPGYAVIKKLRLLASHPVAELSFGYVLTILIFGLLSASAYILGLSQTVVGIVGWLIIVGALVVFIASRQYADLWKLRLPLACLILLTVLATAFFGLTFNSKYSFIPDPAAQAGRNYQSLNVKVLNISQTQANDNYIPYRQAQFMVNRSDPAKDSFINEWGVTFFQRTPLMGSVTATYFILLREKPPVDYTWSHGANDPRHTYLQFQVIAHVLNSLFILPAYLLLSRLFGKKAAALTSFFLVPSQFFLYNNIFSWPKSLVAFFILLSWWLLIENKLRFTLLAGMASGLAYLAHDLALLYIAASFLFLLWNKRLREIVIFGFMCVAFVLPWVLVSTLAYHKPSSFILYPLSTRGIPQAEQKRLVIDQFFDTSPLRIAYIRFENLVYWLTPTQLFTSEGGQAGFRRLWAAGIFSIPGALGLGLMIPAVAGLLKKITRLPFWIFTGIPLALALFVIGWYHGMGALHFAQPIVILLSGLAVTFLANLKRTIWIMLAYAANTVQLVFFATYSFKFGVGVWLTTTGDILRLCLVVGVVLFSGWLIYMVQSGRKTWLTT